MKNHKILIIGAEGQLGSEFDHYLNNQQMDHLAPKEKDCNITNISQIAEIVGTYKPTVIINCAAYNAVDEAEEKSDLAYLINMKAVEQIAELCKKKGCLFVHYSSDYVFDGQKNDLYTEEDATNPLNIYGKSKLGGEQAVLETSSEFLVFRLSWVIGRGQQNFLHKLANWAKSNKILRISADEVSVPTFTDDVVKLTIEGLNAGLSGLYHLTSSDYASRYELARFYIEQAKLPNVIVPVAMSTFATKAPRPLFSAMSNHKLATALNRSIPSWKEGLCRFIA